MGRQDLVPEWSRMLDKEFKYHPESYICGEIYRGLCCH